MKMSLGHPVLIFLYSLALLLFGCAIGIYWRNSLWSASKVALLGPRSWLFMIGPRL